MAGYPMCAVNLEVRICQATIDININKVNITLSLGWIQFELYAATKLLSRISTTHISSHFPTMDLSLPASDGIGIANLPNQVRERESSANC